MRASTSCSLQNQQFFDGHSIRNTSGHTQAFSPSTRDMRLHDAQYGQESPCTLHAPGVALRHAFCHPPTAPRHASSEKQQFRDSVELLFVEMRCLSGILPQTRCLRSQVRCSSATLPQTRCFSPMSSEMFKFLKMLK